MLRSVIAQVYSRGLWTYLDDFLLLIRQQPLRRILRKTPLDHLLHFQRLHPQEVQYHIIRQPELGVQFARYAKDHGVQCCLLLNPIFKLYCIVG